MNWLDEISKRAEAANPGPWASKRLRSANGSELIFIGPNNSFTMDYKTHEFIAHSRTDIPKLIEALRAEQARATLLEEKLAIAIKHLELLTDRSAMPDLLRADGIVVYANGAITQIAELGAKE